jgi:hypothetical protein
VPQTTAVAQTTGVVETSVVVQTTVEAGTTLLAAPTTVATTGGGGTSGWIWVAIAILIAAIAAFVIIRDRRRRQARAAWASAVGRAVTEGQVVVGQFGLRQTAPGDSEPALQRQLLAFDATLAALQGSAPSPERERTVAEARDAVATLGAALESDLRLRVGPPAPTEDQLDTSSTVIDERVRELDAAVERLEMAPATTS